jgi:squalene synthase HpnC
MPTNPKQQAPADTSKAAEIDDHYENFPVASWLCPPALRPPIKAIYAFARIADDIADEGDATTAQRLAALADYAQALEQTLQGEPPDHTPWPRLAVALREHQLPAQLLRDLLSAFTQDVTTTRYDSHAALADYCRRSANPIGRLLLHLYGVSDAMSLQQSDDICSALQLINFWQDVGVDAVKNVPHGRVYLPLDSLSKFGVSDTQIKLRYYNANFAALMKHECDMARAMMLRGAPLALSLPLKGRMGWELRLVVQGGLRILRKIEAVNYNVFTQRPQLNAFDAPVMGINALLMRQ